MNVSAAGYNISRASPKNCRSPKDKALIEGSPIQMIG